MEEARAVNQRLQQFLAFKFGEEHGWIKDAADTIGVRRYSIKVISQAPSICPSTKFLFTLHAAFPKLNMGWVFHGIGSMEL